MSEIATLIVHRGPARDGPVRGEADRVSRYQVPFVPGQSVLDGLRYVRATLDPTLSIRYSCISANSCKECMIVIDGKTAYACTTRLAPRDMVLAPLPNKPHLTDLVTEIAPPDERLVNALKRAR